MFTSLESACKWLEFEVWEEKQKQLAESKQKMPPTGSQLKALVLLGWRGSMPKTRGQAGIMIRELRKIVR